MTRFPEFRDFIRSRSTKNEKEEDTTETELANNKTPEEFLEYGYQKIRSDLASELLVKIQESSPSFFEKLVIELLLKIGYGGSRKEAGKTVGRSGDGGIDGIIKEDKLGLDIIYIQAKRWEATVGRPEIQKFAGALQGQRAKKGIFITTANFSKDAREYASMIDNKIVLIDGEELTNLMIDYGVGVSRLAIYEIKRIDTDYFTEE